MKIDKKDQYINETLRTLNNVPARKHFGKNSAERQHYDELIKKYPPAQAAVFTNLRVHANALLDDDIDQNEINDVLSKCLRECNEFSGISSEDLAKLIENEKLGFNYTYTSPTQKPKTILPDLNAAHNAVKELEKQMNKGTSPKSPAPQKIVEKAQTLFPAVTPELVSAHLQLILLKAPSDDAVNNSHKLRNQIQIAQTKQPIDPAIEMKFKLDDSVEAEFENYHQTKELKEKFEENNFELLHDAIHEYITHQPKDADALTWDVNAVNEVVNILISKIPKKSLTYLNATPDNLKKPAEKAAKLAGLDVFGQEAVEKHNLEYQVAQTQKETEQQLDSFIGSQRTRLNKAREEWDEQDAQKRAKDAEFSSKIKANAINAWRKLQNKTEFTSDKQAQLSESFLGGMRAKEVQHHEIEQALDKIGNPYLSALKTQIVDFIISNITNQSESALNTPQEAALTTITRQVNGFIATKLQSASRPVSISSNLTPEEIQNVAMPASPISYLEQAKQQHIAKAQEALVQAFEAATAAQNSSTPVQGVDVNPTNSIDKKENKKHNKPAPPEGLPPATSSEASKPAPLPLVEQPQTPGINIEELAAQLAAQREADKLEKEENDNKRRAEELERINAEAALTQAIPAPSVPLPSAQAPSVPLPSAQAPDQSLEASNLVEPISIETKRPNLEEPKQAFMTKHSGKPASEDDVKQLTYALVTSVKDTDSVELNQESIVVHLKNTIIGKLRDRTKGEQNFLDIEFNDEQCEQAATKALEILWSKANSLSRKFTTSVHNIEQTLDGIKFSRLDRMAILRPKKSVTKVLDILNSLLTDLSNDEKDYTILYDAQIPADRAKIISYLMYKKLGENKVNEIWEKPDPYRKDYSELIKLFKSVPIQSTLQVLPNRFNHLLNNLDLTPELEAPYVLAEIKKSNNPKPSSFKPNQPKAKTVTWSNPISTEEREPEESIESKVSQAIEPSSEELLAIQEALRKEQEEAQLRESSISPSASDSLEHKNKPQPAIDRITSSLPPLSTGSKSNLTPEQYKAAWDQQATTAYNDLMDLIATDAYNDLMNLIATDDFHEKEIRRILDNSSSHGNTGMINLIFRNDQGLPLVVAAEKYLSQLRGNISSSNEPALVSLLQYVKDYENTTPRGLEAYRIDDVMLNNLFLGENQQGMSFESLCSEILKHNPSEKFTKLYDELHTKVKKFRKELENWERPSQGSSSSSSSTSSTKPIASIPISEDQTKAQSTLNNPNSSQLRGSNMVTLQNLIVAAVQVKNLQSTSNPQQLQEAIYELKKVSESLIDQIPNLTVEDLKDRIKEIEIAKTNQGYPATTADNDVNKLLDQYQAKLNSLNQVQISITSSTSPVPETKADVSSSKDDKPKETKSKIEPDDSLDTNYDPESKIDSNEPNYRYFSDPSSGLTAFVDTSKFIVKAFTPKDLGALQITAPEKSLFLHLKPRDVNDKTLKPMFNVLLHNKSGTSPSDQKLRDAECDTAAKALDALQKQPEYQDTNISILQLDANISSHIPMDPDNITDPTNFVTNQIGLENLMTHLTPKGTDLAVTKIETSSRIGIKQRTNNMAGNQQGESKWNTADPATKAMTIVLKRKSSLNPKDIPTVDSLIAEIPPHIETPNKFGIDLKDSDHNQTNPLQENATTVVMKPFINVFGQMGFQKEADLYEHVAKTPQEKEERDFKKEQLTRDFLFILMSKLENKGMKSPTHLNKQALKNQETTNFNEYAEFIKDNQWVLMDRGTLTQIATEYSKLHSLEECNQLYKAERRVFKGTSEQIQKSIEDCVDKILDKNYKASIDKNTNPDVPVSEPAKNELINLKQSAEGISYCLKNHEGKFYNGTFKGEKLNKNNLKELRHRVIVEVNKNNPLPANTRPTVTEGAQIINNFSEYLAWQLNAGFPENIAEWDPKADQRNTTIEIARSGADIASHTEDSSQKHLNHNKPAQQRDAEQRDREDYVKKWRLGKEETCLAMNAARKEFNNGHSSKAQKMAETTLTKRNKAKPDYQLWFESLENKNPGLQGLINKLITQHLDLKSKDERVKNFLSNKSNMGTLADQILPEIISDPKYDLNFTQSKPLLKEYVMHHSAMALLNAKRISELKKSEKKKASSQPTASVLETKAPLTQTVSVETPIVTPENQASLSSSGATHTPESGQAAENTSDLNAASKSFQTIFISNLNEYCLNSTGILDLNTVYDAVYKKTLSTTVDNLFPEEEYLKISTAKVCVGFNALQEKIKSGLKANTIYIDKEYIETFQNASKLTAVDKNIVMKFVKNYITQQNKTKEELKPAQPTSQPGQPSQKISAQPRVDTKLETPRQTNSASQQLILRDTIYKNIFSIAFNPQDRSKRDSSTLYQDAIKGLDISLLSKSDSDVLKYTAQTIVDLLSKFDHDLHQNNLQSVEKYLTPIIQSFSLSPNTPLAKLIKDFIQDRLDVQTRAMSQDSEFSATGAPKSLTPPPQQKQPSQHLGTPSHAPVVTSHTPTVDPKAIQFQDYIDNAVVFICLEQLDTSIDNMYSAVIARARANFDPSYNPSNIKESDVKADITDVSRKLRVLRADIPINLQSYETYIEEIKSKLHIKNNFFDKAIETFIQNQITLINKADTIPLDSRAATPIPLNPENYVQGYPLKPDGSYADKLDHFNKQGLSSDELRWREYSDGTFDPKLETKTSSASDHKFSNVASDPTLNLVTSHLIEELQRYGNNPCDPVFAKNLKESLQRILDSGSSEDTGKQIWNVIHSQLSAMPNFLPAEKLHKIDLLNVPQEKIFHLQKLAQEIAEIPTSPQSGVSTMLTPEENNKLRSYLRQQLPWEIIRQHNQQRRNPFAPWEMTDINAVLARIISKIDIPSNKKSEIHDTLRHGLMANNQSFINGIIEKEALFSYILNNMDSFVHAQLNGIETDNPQGEINFNPREHGVDILRDIRENLINQGNPENEVIDFLKTYAPSIQSLLKDTVMKQIGNRTKARAQREEGARAAPPLQRAPSTLQRMTTGMRNAANSARTRFGATTPQTAAMQASKPTIENLRADLIRRIRTTYSQELGDTTTINYFKNPQREQEFDLRHLSGDIAVFKKAIRASFPKMSTQEINQFIESSKQEAKRLHDTQAVQLTLKGINPDSPLKAERDRHFIRYVGLIKDKFDSECNTRTVQEYQNTTSQTDVQKWHSDNILPIKNRIIKRMKKLGMDDTSAQQEATRAVREAALSHDRYVPTLEAQLEADLAETNRNIQDNINDQITSWAGQLRFIESDWNAKFMLGTPTVVAKKMDIMEAVSNIILPILEGYKHNSGITIDRSKVLAQLAHSIFRQPQELSNIKGDTRAVRARFAKIFPNGIPEKPKDQNFAVKKVYTPIAPSASQAPIPMAHPVNPPPALGTRGTAMPSPAGTPGDNIPAAGPAREQSALDAAGPLFDDNVKPDWAKMEDETASVSQSMFNRAGIAARNALRKFGSASKAAVKRATDSLSKELNPADKEKLDEMVKSCQFDLFSALRRNEPVEAKGRIAAFEGAVRASNFAKKISSEKISELSAAITKGATKDLEDYQRLVASYSAVLKERNPHLLTAANATIENDERLKALGKLAFKDAKAQQKLAAPKPADSGAKPDGKPVTFSGAKPALTPAKVSTDTVVAQSKEYTETRKMLDEYIKPLSEKATKDPKKPLSKGGYGFSDKQDKLRIAQQAEAILNQVKTEAPTAQRLVLINQLIADNKKATGHPEIPGFGSKLATILEKIEQLVTLSLAKDPMKRLQAYITIAKTVTKVSNDTGLAGIKTNQKAKIENADKILDTLRKDPTNADAVIEAIKANKKATVTLPFQGDGKLDGILKELLVKAAGTKASANDMLKKAGLPEIPAASAKSKKK